ncbi:hypothetical protein T4B_10794 [Trichinella pseudospiralis]|uniref:Uncharacterized protein n=1 Tax=Trichinella pseudospiralis TaxID=6337 RepID=A0A0V1GDG2_TRIPS|nr:hypothetical protein T4B_10794 [Trichinella pseudospiralis]
MSINMTRSAPSEKPNDISKQCNNDDELFHNQLYR